MLPLRLNSPLGIVSKLVFRKEKSRLSLNGFAYKCHVPPYSSKWIYPEVKFRLKSKISLPLSFKQLLTRELNTIFDAS